MFTLPCAIHAQPGMDTVNQSGRAPHPDSTVVVMQDSTIVIYRKPRPFSPITQLPKTLTMSARITFRKQSVPAILMITGATIGLIGVDQKITNGIQHFGNELHIDPTRSYGKSLSFKLGNVKFDVYDVPRNANSMVYSLGEGLASVAISGGLFTYGKIKRDYRAIQTANQILQVQLAVGVLTQTMKRISGRQSAFQATVSGGRWRPFPDFSTYQKNTSNYDAFPSGHLATMMATVTVLALNYPEKKWIRYVGGSLITLVGLAMINNGVHWAGDYPLALGIGYVTAHATVKMNRLLQYKR